MKYKISGVIFKALRQCLLVAGVAWVTGAGVSHAATSVMIWPIDPIIESDQRAVALWLENRDKKPVTIQVRVVGWSQANYEHHYESDQERVVGSPPMATVPPGKRQLIRLIRAEDSAPGTEDAYRVLIDEVPQPDEGEGGGAALGVKLLMHYSIPLFVYGKGLSAKADPLHRGGDPVAAPLLSWQVSQEGKQRWLVITNRGRIHARLTHVGFEAHGARTEMTSGLLDYVLAGTQMRWPVPSNVGSIAEAELSASVNGVNNVIIDSESAK